MDALLILAACYIAALAVYHLFEKTGISVRVTPLTHRPMPFLSDDYDFEETTGADILRRAQMDTVIRLEDYKRRRA